MSTLIEIEAAVKKLPAKEKEQLLMLLAQSLRAERQQLPEPRQFSAAETAAWMDEDERDMNKLRGQG
jgi:hypothetical protein